MRKPWGPPATSSGSAAPSVTAAATTLPRATPRPDEFYSDDERKATVNEASWRGPRRWIPRAATVGWLNERMRR